MQNFQNKAIDIVLTKTKDNVKKWLSMNFEVLVIIETSLS